MVTDTGCITNNTHFFFCYSWVNFLSAFIEGLGHFPRAEVAVSRDCATEAPDAPAISAADALVRGRFAGSAAAVFLAAPAVFVLAPVLAAAVREAAFFGASVPAAFVPRRAAVFLACGSFLACGA